MMNVRKEKEADNGHKAHELLLEAGQLILGSYHREGEPQELQLRLIPDIISIPIVLRIHKAEEVNEIIESLMQLRDEVFGAESK